MNEVGGDNIRSDCSQLIGLSKGQKILVHLLNFYDQKDKDIVSELITLGGIQRVINCDLCHVSRELNKYIENEYVYRKLMLIENKNRKFNSYFLTEKGYKLTLVLKESMSTFDIGNIKQI